jgi:hypothetical protein
MARYVRDEQLRNFQAKVREEVERIGKLATGAAYFIYLILDPTKEDPRGYYEEGLPLYVGQTKQMRARADSHMRDGGGGSTDDTIKGDRLKPIMDQYIVPTFRLLDTAPTHLTSLIAETVWARRHVWLGYELANCWPEHLIAKRPNGLASIPPVRLRRLTVAEAIEDEVTVALACRRCDTYAEVDLESLNPNVKLATIRARKPTCAICGSPMFRLKKPDALTWRWAGYTPTPMPPRVRDALQDLKIRS